MLPILEPIPARGLSAYLSQFVRSENYRGSLAESIHAEQLTEFLFGFREEESNSSVFAGQDSEAMLGSVFWQLYTCTDQFYKAFDLYKDAEQIISTNGTGQYTLLVFDENYNANEPYVQEIHIEDDGTLEEAVHKWMAKYLLTPSGIRLPSMFPYNFRTIELLLQRFMLDVSKEQRFQLVRATAPRRRTVQCFQNRNSLGVRNDSEAVSSSTAGVIAEREDGHRGITVALHAVHPNVSSVWVKGVRCQVLSRDNVSDSCFVVPESDDVFQDCMATKGPLIGKTPRGYQEAEYHGLTSGRRKTIIDSWSKDLPFVAPYNQLKVFTKDKVSPGDSGSALIDDENNVVGFAFYIPGFGAPVDFTAWIWAESVFRVHHLKT